MSKFEYSRHVIYRIRADKRSDKSACQMRGQPLAGKQMERRLQEQNACREQKSVSKHMSPTSGVIGLFTGPHHTFFSDPSSLTIRLSRGDRPVFAPEYAVIAPVDVIAEPVS